MLRFALFCVFALLAAWPAGPLYAHTGATSQDSVASGLVPTGGFSIDAGFGGGALYQYQRYDRETTRIRQMLRLSGSAYSKGIYTLETKYEQRSDTGRCFRATLFAEQSQTAAFFGIGAGREFSRQDFDDGLYHYNRVGLLLELSYGRPLGGREGLEWFRMLSTGYVNHYDFDDSVLGERRPFGAEGGFRQGLHTGFEADLRNHFFRPSAGSFHRAELSIHPSLTGNRRTLGKLNLETAYYHEFHFLLDVVLAGRVQLQQTAGRAPFYELSMLGGQESLRGYPEERFRDYGSIMTTIELRTWLFSIPFQQIQIGGQLFADGGTLYEYPGAPGWTNDMLGNIGFGGMMSLFNPDFMVRGDFGFSDETFRFSAGIGYLF